MKTLISFLLTLYMLSPGGNKVVYGSIPSASNHQSAVHELVVTKLLERTIEKQQSFIANPKELNASEEDAIIAEDGRDDETIRKSRLLPTGFSVFIYPYIASRVYHEDASPGYFPAYNPAIHTARYISHRALRI